MSTLRFVLQSLTRLPRGYAADGRSLGLGLASALQAQQEQSRREERGHLDRVEPWRAERGTAATSGAESRAV